MVTIKWQNKGFPFVFILSALIKIANAFITVKDLGAFLNVQK